MKMNMKRLAIGSLVGAVTLYVLGIVIWEMVFANFFAANSGSATGVEKDPQVIWAIVLGTLLYAELVTLGLESRGSSVSIADGFKVGAVIGLLLWGTTDLILFGYTNLNNLTGVIGDIALEGVRGGICGAVVAGVLAKVGN
jgi:hypothetical protein